jgi:hypothetical protein
VCAPVIAVLFIGFTINRQDTTGCGTKHWTYRGLILANVFLLLIALIDTVRVLGKAAPLSPLGFRLYPFLPIGAIAFSTTSLGLSFFRMSAEEPRTDLRLARSVERVGAIKPFLATTSQKYWPDDMWGDIMPPCPRLTRPHG